MATKIANIKGPVGVKGDTGATGATGATGPIAVSTDASNNAVLGTDTAILVPTIPLASNTQSGLLRQVSGLTTDFVDGSNHTQDLATAIKPTIWSTRVRSFNALGNPNMEICQLRSGGYAFADRWSTFQNPSLGTWSRQTGNVSVPGTNYTITGSYLRYTLTTQKTSLSSFDAIYLFQQIEGSQLRELVNDVFSVSILVRSSVAPLNIGLVIQEPGYTYSLSKLCPLSTANSWTIVTIPNIPKFAPGFTWAITPGVIGYLFHIAIAAGSGYLNSPNDVWTSHAANSYYGATGQDNFAAGAVNSTFDIAFVQHEPGSVCTPPIDIPFDKNLRACQRYYSKSCGYTGTLPTSSANYKWIGTHISASTAVRTNIHFPVEMAKAPTVSMYDYLANANQVYLEGIGNVAISSLSLIDGAGVGAITLSATQTTPYGGAGVLGQWKADTGW